MSVWETSGPGVPATLDFLTTLQSALVARGLNYRVAATSANANIGPVPLVSPWVDRGGRLPGDPEGPGRDPGGCR
ncbi:MAG: hypothetical protein IPK24_10980 [Kineosporiaceae bacterium]|nr:hypothetical protein [Kineosporiaceae bacterium]